MLRRYLKTQLLVLLGGGLVGPIFLVVFFALGQMARPVINWMFWTGLVITAVDILAALALTSRAAKTEVRQQHLTRSGVLCTARITGIHDTPLFINDQQMIKVALRVDVPGAAGFDTVQTLASSPAKMQVLAGRTLVAVVEPGTENYEIDWNASGLLAGVVPAEFTVDEDHTTYDLTGRAEPLMQILRVLHANRMPLDGTIDIRSNPVVRQQILEIVRGAGGEHPAPRTVSQRLQELETLHATGTITQAEYEAKRRDILGQL